MSEIYINYNPKRYKMENELVELLKALAIRNIPFKMSILCPNDKIYKSLVENYIGLFPGNKIGVHGIGDSRSEKLQIEISSWYFRSIWEK